MPEQHAFLSASSAHRWLNCTASPEMSKGIENKSTEYAEEGTTAHALAEAILTSNVDKAFEARQSEYYNPDMEDYVDSYVNYAKGVIDTGDKWYIERKVDLGSVVPDGFGTVDCYVLNLKEKLITVIDLKYGKGIEVNATDNPQLKLYAIGALHDAIKERVIDVADIYSWSVKTVIFQPRLHHVDDCVYKNISSLIEWGNQVREKARRAFSGRGVEIKSGEWCRFCPAKIRCREYAGVRESFIEKIFPRDLYKLSNEELSELLERLSEFNTYAQGVKDELIEAIKTGGDTKGYTLKEVKGKRILTPDGYKHLEDEGVEVTKTSYVSLTELERTCGKRYITQATEGFIEYGKPSYRLVKKQDVAKEVFGLG